MDFQTWEHCYLSYSQKLFSSFPDIECIPQGTTYTEYTASW